MTGINTAMKPLVFYNPADAEYHRIMSEIQGPVTNEKLNKIDEERKEIDNDYANLKNISGDSEDDKAYRMIVLKDIQSREEGLSRVEKQREFLRSIDGTFSGKYFVDEASYEKIFKNSDTDILRFFIAAAIYAIFISSVEYFDSSKNIYNILYSCKRGRLIKDNKRRIYIISGLIAFACMAIPEILSFYRIDRFSCGLFELIDTYSVIYTESIPLIVAIILIFVIKFILFEIYAIALGRISEISKNESLTVGAGIGLAAVISLLLSYMNLNVSILFLSMLR